MASEHCTYRLDSECGLLYSREQQESICSQQLLANKDNRLNAQGSLKAPLATAQLVLSFSTAASYLRAYLTLEGLQASQVLQTTPNDNPRKDAASS
jgi:hypothetical protein